MLIDKLNKILIEIDHIYHKQLNGLESDGKESFF